MRKTSNWIEERIENTWLIEKHFSFIETPEKKILEAFRTHFNNFFFSFFFPSTSTKRFSSHFFSYNSLIDAL